VRIRMNRASTRGNNGKEEKETRKRPADITNGGGVIFFFGRVARWRMTEAINSMASAGW
jgi:hypothetical protein